MCRGAAGPGDNETPGSPESEMVTRRARRDGRRSRVLPEPQWGSWSRGGAPEGKFCLSCWIQDGVNTQVWPKNAGLHITEDAWPETS